MIYLNNAATSYPKPPCVVDAVQACLMGAPVSQFRGGVELRKEDSTTACRRMLGELLGIEDWKRIVFTSGATESCNQLICGLDYEENKGDSVQILTTQTEHNSILRPLLNQPAVKEYGVTVIPCTSTGRITKEALENSITDVSKVLFINHCSNVTGQVQDLEMIAEVCHQHGILVIADLSQSAGCIPVNVDKWKLDGIIFTGHKSLFGMQGIGGFYLREGIKLKPLKYGGTGRNSAQLTYEMEDYEYEVGTQNQPGIEALRAGVGFILENGLEKIVEKEQNLMRLLYDGLNGCENVVLYNQFSTEHGPVMSFNINGLAPSDVAYILQNVYGITVRTGLHCAPLIHKAMGTGAKGTVRVSVSYLTEESDLEALIDAVKDISGSVQIA